MNDIQEGLCQCGCGEKTKLSPVTRKKYNYIKGQPQKYIRGHQFKIYPPHKVNGNGRTINHGYYFVYCPTHPRSNSNGYVYEHLIIAEHALGKFLPITSVIHHIDGNGLNNNPANLLICENSDYHKFLHARMRAKDSCGNAKWKRCSLCKKYDDPINMYNHPKKQFCAWHRECHKLYYRVRRATKRIKYKG